MVSAQFSLLLTIAIRLLILNLGQAFLPLHSTFVPSNRLQQPRLQHLRQHRHWRQRPSPSYPQHIPLFSSFTADGSEYSSRDSSDNEDEEDLLDRESFYDRSEDKEQAETIELSPVPMSKNAGNRFVAILWDRELDTKGRSAMELFYERIEYTEDHVMFCRKANLYNETFNTESMVDVMWSLPILSSDLQRVIGHALCLETTKIEYIYELLEREPIVSEFLALDNVKEQVPLYRWRHIRDYSLRRDDGRFGFPCMCLGMDDVPEHVGNLRQDLHKEQLEYLIRSEKVIAAGPLHMPTEFKDDPSSFAVGDLILFNAKDRNDAIQFAENMPVAQAGLYDDLRVHFYNTLDVTGKFVSENRLGENPCADMKEALEYWGYPVDDAQTPWLNW